MKKQPEIKKTRALKNNLYCVRLMWDISRGAVIHAGLMTAFNYIAWVFYSAFFIKYLVGALNRADSFSDIFRYILLAGGFFMATAIYYAYVEGAYIPMAGVKVYHKLYRKLYQKARNVELRCFEDSSFYNKYTLAVDGANEKLIQVIINLFGIICGAIAATVVFTQMFHIDKTAVLFVFFPIIGNFVFGYIYNKYLFNRDRAMAPYKRRIEYVNRVMYLADYSKEMRLSNVFYLMKYKYLKAIDGIFDVVDQYAFKINLPLWFRNYFTFTIIFEGVLLYGAYRTIVGKTMSLSELAVLSSIMVSATWILIRFAENILESMKQGLFIENLRTFLEYEENLPEDYDGLTPEPEITSIEFRNVSFGYKKEEYIIKNLSFRIEGKKSIALVGHNGAGKTTIIKLLFRLYDPDEGEILLNDKNIKEYNLKAYRSLFAAAFQDYKVFALSIKENVLMRKGTPKDDTLVIEALKKAGVYDKVMTLPDGINTNLTKEFDEQGAQLSGGEFQKIVVARAFAKNVPIKVFDEPSSALDPIAEYDLYESILKDSFGKTMIFISHRLSSVRNADMVYMLEKGTIIEQGSHIELMDLHGAYADMYQKQAKNYLAVESLREVTA
ncbi:ABC transporter ATP-binding protein [Mobilitalea sibirica]|uniref:ABC transporter ATP-binding protein n=2 Tax=Mobilitalea sibirica TaxID=1462919 RepID=A0A8J7GYW0_9FIRM|nr:ABC transporter ATP-binding protein [Mobilitalea sibirica]